MVYKSKIAKVERTIVVPDTTNLVEAYAYKHFGLSLVRATILASETEAKQKAETMETLKKSGQYAADLVQEIVNTLFPSAGAGEQTMFDFTNGFPKPWPAIGEVEPEEGEKEVTPE